VLQDDGVRRSRAKAVAAAVGDSAAAARKRAEEARKKNQADPRKGAEEARAKAQKDRREQADARKDTGTRQGKSAGKRPPLVPLFVLGFLAMVAVRSTGIVPQHALDVAQTLTTLLLAGALFGLGCAVKVGPLIRTGPRALLLGLLSTLLIGAVAYATLTWLG
jgi:Flp pilus assembly protein TadB